MPQRKIRYSPHAFHYIYLHLLWGISRNIKIMNKKKRTMTKQDVELEICDYITDNSKKLPSIITYVGETYKHSSQLSSVKCSIITLQETFRGEGNYRFIGDIDAIYKEANGNFASIPDLSIEGHANIIKGIDDNPIVSITDTISIRNKF
jgi:hypothetical protein